MTIHEPTGEAWDQAVRGKPITTRHTAFATDFGTRVGSTLEPVWRDIPSSKFGTVESRSPSGPGQARS